MAANGNSEKLKEDKNEANDKLSVEKSPPVVRQLTREDLAPDGGWGWMIATGMTISQLLSFAQLACFPLLYGDFLEASGNGGAAVSILNLTFMISFSVSGLVCNELLKRYCIKFVGIFGAAIFSVSNTLACLVPSVSYLMISFFFQGIGVGIMMTVGNISINAYFVKRKTKVMGAIHVFAGLGTVIFPILIEKLLRAYGFRGTVALLGAVSFNAIVSMSVMDPVEWHYKMPNNITQKEAVSDSEKLKYNNIKDQLLLDGQKVDITRRHSMDVSKGWEKNKSALSLRAETERETPLLIDESKASHRSHDRIGSGLDIEIGLRSRRGKGSTTDFLSNRISATTATSMSSIGGIPTFGKIVNVSEAKNADDKKKRKSIASALADFFEVSLLRDGIYLNMCIGISLTFLTDLTFGGFLPMMMADRGYSKAHVAWTITVTAITEVVSKIVFTIYSMFIKTKARYIFLGAVYSLFIIRIVFLFCNTLTSIIIVHAMSGFVRTWYMIPQALVFAEYFEIEKFPAALGLFTVINGGASIIVCPLIGLIKDWTNSYFITQCVLIGGLMVCLVPWTVEILVYNIFKRPKTSEAPSQK